MMRKIETMYYPQVEEGETYKMVLSHDKGVYKIQGYKVKLEKKQTYTMETTLIYQNDFKYLILEEGRYSEKKAQSYKKRFNGNEFLCNFVKVFPDVPLGVTNYLQEVRNV